jgi:hypothetical protein
LVLFWRSKKEQENRKLLANTKPLENLIPALAVGLKPGFLSANFIPCPKGQGNSTLTYLYCPQGF